MLFTPHIYGQNMDFSSLAGPSGYIKVIILIFNRYFQLAMQFGNLLYILICFFVPAIYPPTTADFARKGRCLTARCKFLSPPNSQLPIVDLGLGSWVLDRVSLHNSVLATKSPYLKDYTMFYADKIFLLGHSISSHRRIETNNNKTSHTTQKNMAQP